MKRKAFDAVTADWEQLLAAVAANQDDLPQEEPFRVQLEAHLTDLRVLQAQRAALQVKALQATQDLRDALAWGLDLVTRIRDRVRGHYGFRNDKLTEFGIRPSRKRKEAACPGGEKDKSSPGSVRTVR